MFHREPRASNSPRQLSLPMTREFDSPTGYHRRLRNPLLGVQQSPSLYAEAKCMPPDSRRGTSTRHRKPGSRPATAQINDVAPSSSLRTLLPANVFQRSRSTLLLVSAYSRARFSKSALIRKDF